MNKWKLPEAKEEKGEDYSRLNPASGLSPQTPPNKAQESLLFRVTHLEQTLEGVVKYLVEVTSRLDKIELTLGL